MSAFGQKQSVIHDDYQPRAGMRKSRLANNKLSSSAISFSYYGDTAIEMVGVPAVFMLRKLCKPRKRKPPVEISASQPSQQAQLVRGLAG